MAPLLVRGRFCCNGNRDLLLHQTLYLFHFFHRTNWNTIRQPSNWSDYPRTKTPEKLETNYIITLLSTLYKIISGVDVDVDDVDDVDDIDDIDDV